MARPASEPLRLKRARFLVEVGLRTKRRSDALLPIVYAPPLIDGRQAPLLEPETVARAIDMEIGQMAVARSAALRVKARTQAREFTIAVARQLAVRRQVLGMAAPTFFLNDSPYVITMLSDTKGLGYERNPLMQDKPHPALARGCLAKEAPTNNAELAIVTELRAAADAVAAFDTVQCARLAAENQCQQQQPQNSTTTCREAVRNRLQSPRLASSLREIERCEARLQRCEGLLGQCLAKLEQIATEIVDLAPDDRPRSFVSEMRLAKLRDRKRGLRAHCRQLSRLLFNDYRDIAKKKARCEAIAANPPRSTTKRVSPSSGGGV